MIFSYIAGGVAIIALFIALIKTMRELKLNYGWIQMMYAIFEYIEEAESEFKNGEDKKQYVLEQIEKLANEIGYKINIIEIGEFIDCLVSFSKKVNIKKTKKKKVE